jgi:lysophospholipase L1-like esterase
VGARVCVWTPLPKNFSAGEDAIRLAFRSYLLSRAALGEFDVIDIDPTMSSGATPATIATAYRFDTTHYNAAGMDVLAALGADYLRSSG